MENNIITLTNNNGYLNERGNAVLITADGKKVEITNKETSQHLDALAYLQKFQKLSGIAKCYEMSRITEKVASDFGFSSVSKMIQLNYSEWDNTEVQRNRRVGRIFIYRMFINDPDNPDNVNYTYGYRGAIPDGVSVTNLGRILPLLNVSREKWSKLDEFTDDECEEIVNEFVETYILTDKIHLLSSLPNLKEEISKLMPKSGEKKKTAEKTDEKTDEIVSRETSEVDLSVDEIAKTHVDALCAYFAGNTKVLKKLAEIADIINARIDSETENA